MLPIYALYLSLAAFLIGTGLAVPIPNVLENNALGVVSTNFLVHVH